MKRRGLLYGGVAAVAVLLGAGVAWQRKRLKPAADPAVAAFWDAVLDSPDGQSVPLSRFRGQPLLVNFWATWCPPCVEELPLLSAFHQQHQAKGWQVLGIAIDQPSAVRQWLQRSPLAFPVVMAGLQGTDMSRSLGNQAGGLPFSVLFGSQSQLIERKLGQLRPGDLQAWARLL